jgi:ribosomal protein S18 acetylase RimI-like enzyme
VAADNVRAIACYRRVGFQRFAGYDRFGHAFEEWVIRL